MQLEGIHEDWRRWVMQDPSAIRVHLAANSFNWDNGMEFLLWISEQDFLPRAAIGELTVNSDPWYFKGVRNREEAAQKALEGGQIFQLLENLSSSWEERSGEVEQISPSRYYFEFFEKKGNRLTEEALASGLPFPFMRDLDKLKRNLLVPNYRNDLKGEDRRAFYELNNWIYEE